MRSTSGIALLVVLLAGCGAGSGPDAADEARSTARPPESFETTPPRATPPQERSGTPGGPDRLTVEYLTGEWCFRRESGGGERGVIEFAPDGTNRSGVTLIQGEYRLEERRETLEDFHRSYPQVVEIERDGFVGLLHDNYRVIFERAPC